MPSKTIEINGRKLWLNISVANDRVLAVLQDAKNGDVIDTHFVSRALVENAWR